MKNTIEETVKSFKTNSEFGFTNEEIVELLKLYPTVDIEKFNNALVGITCMVIEGEMIIYHCDVISALYCGLENRELRSWEWD